MCRTTRPPRSVPETLRLPSPGARLHTALVEAVGSSPHDQRGFLALVNEVHRLKREEAIQFEHGLREVLAQFLPACPHARRRFTRQVRAAEDPDQIPRFDEMLHFAQRHCPHLFRFDSSGSPEEAFFRMVKTGRIYPPARHSAEVIDEAMDLAHSMGWGRAPRQPSPETLAMEF